MTLEHAHLQGLAKPVPVNQSQKPWEFLSRVLHFQCSDYQLWWDVLAPVFGATMAITGYSLDAQYRHLLVIYTSVIPSLGPFPKPDGTNITWASPFPPGPLEASVNYQEGSTVFRFTLEPTGAYAGTEADPINELAARQLLQRLSHLQAGVDFSMFDHFRPLLGVDGHEGRKNWDVISPLPYKCHTAMALDMRRDSRYNVKAYFPPFVRATMLGSDVIRVMFDGLRKYREASGLHFDYTKVEEFMIANQHMMMTEKSYVSFDCKEPAQSRIKVYTEAKVKALLEVYSFWTLGGRLSGPEIEKGFQLVTKMWNAIYAKRLPNGKHRESMHIQVNWEMSPKDTSVVPKLYFTVMDDYDEYISSAVVDLFKDLGWTEHIQTHKAIEKEA
jgi:fumigaclavine A dimethylallyltransferase